MGTASLVGVLQADVRCACHIGKTLYTADTQGTVLAWNVQDATNQIFMSGLAAPVNALVSVNKGAEMWAGLANGNIANMRLESRSFGNQIVHAHDAAVNCIAEGSNCVWSGGDDFLIKKWDLQGVALFAYNHHHGSIRDLLVFRNKPEQTHLNLWGSSNDSTISVASVQDSNTQHELTSEVRMLSGHTKAVLVLCKVGVDAIWSGCEDGSIRVWSSLAFGFKKQLNFHKGPVVTLVVMGGHVWSGSGDHTVLVWDASIYQPLFTLGDHGGYVKAMVRVEYMCWVFASGKNVKIWCAQSAWESSEQEKDRLKSDVLKLKDDLEESRRQQYSAGDVSKKAQVSNAEKLSAQDKEIERLRDEKAENAKERERLLKMADESKRDLADENKLLNGNINKLKAENERDKIDAKTKLQEVEKNLMQAHDDIRKSQDISKDVSKEKKINEVLRITTSDKLKDAEDEKRRLENELAQLKESMGRDKSSAESVKASHDKQLGEMGKRLRKMENEAEQSHRKLSSQIHRKDDEAQTLKDELKKTAKDLKNALTSLEEEKARAANSMEELKETLESMKKNHDSMSASETQTAMKFASMEKELQQARNELQVAANEKSQALASKDSDLEKLKIKIRDLRKAAKEAESERNKLQQSFKERESSLDGNKQENNQLRKQIEDLTSAIKARESDLDGMKASLSKTTSEKDEAGKNVQELKTQLESLGQELATAVAGEQRSALQNMSAEKDDLLQKLNDATAEKTRLTEDLSRLRAEPARRGSDGDSAPPEMDKLRQDALDRLQDGELHVGDKRKPTDAPDHSKKEKSSLEHDLALATNQCEQLRNENALHEERAASKCKVFDQLEQRLGQALHDLDELSNQKEAQDGNVANLTQEIDQLKQEKDAQDGNASNLAQEIDKLEQEKDVQDRNAAKLAQEINQLRQEKDVQDKRLATAAEQLQQLMRKNEGITPSVDEVRELKKKIAETEDSLASGTQIEQIRHEKSVQNNNNERIAGLSFRSEKDQTNAVRRLVPPDQELEQNAVLLGTGDELRQTMPEGNRRASAIEKSEQVKVYRNLSDVNISQAAWEREHLEKEGDLLRYQLVMTAEELEQLLKEKASMQVDLARLSDVNISQAAWEREHLEKEGDLLRYRLAKTAEELEQLLKEKASMQVDLARLSDELDDLKNTKRLLEGFITQDTNCLQLGEQKSVLEAHLARVADGLEQQARAKELYEADAIYMAGVNDSLRNQVSMLEDKSAAFQKKNEDMQKEIARLQSLLEKADDECRLTKEIARCDYENAARRIVELEESVTELQETLNNPHLISVEDALWERVRELEMALLQAHIKHNFLNQEINRMRKRRKTNGVHEKSMQNIAQIQPSVTNLVDGVSGRLVKKTLPHNFNKLTPEKIGTPFLGDAVEIAMKAVQPGFSMEYTNLKVSGCSDQKTIQRTVEVAPETSITRTPPVMTPQRQIPIHVPSPAQVPREPVLGLPPLIEEKERYFPSHGALRVRRGLGPPSPTGEFNV